MEDSLILIDWVVFLLLLLLFLGGSAALVATENSSKVLSRRKFCFWITGWFVLELALVPVIPYVAFPIHPHPPDWLPRAFLLAHLILWLFPYRLLVRRCRDAGIEKWLGYVAIIPIVNLVIIVFLLFKRSEKSGHYTFFERP